MPGKGFLLAVIAALVIASLPSPAAARALAESDRTSPPGPITHPDFATARTHTRIGVASVLVSATALPFGYYVDRRLAKRFGTAEIAAAMSQWDGVAGSRWSTRYLGVVDPAAAKAAPDGRSVVFLDTDCGTGAGGHVYRQFKTAGRDDAYGALAYYLTDVDIGVCDAVRDRQGLRAVLAHEVGHALGLDHLCNPDETCWRPGMGPGPHSCRVMYHGPSDCWPRIEARDHDAVRHLYPALPRVSGPTRAETAARASFATVPRRAATVVVARGDKSAHGPLAASALAAALGGPLLLARPDDSGCFGGAAREELGRVGALFTTVVLVGDWPSNCHNALLFRGHRSERIRGTGPVTLSVAVAERLASAGKIGDAAVLVSAAVDEAGHVPDGVAGGAAAAAAGGPVLYTRRDELPAQTAAWLSEQRGLHRVYVLGGSSVVSDRVLERVRAMGLEAVRVAGEDRVTTALALASRAELFEHEAPVVVAGVGGWPDAVTGSALAGRVGAPVLLTPPSVDRRVEAWLAARKPSHGYVVGGTRAVPYAVQWAYTREVGR